MVPPLFSLIKIEQRAHESSGTLAPGHDWPPSLFQFFTGQGPGPSEAVLFSKRKRLIVLKGRAQEDSGATAPEPSRALLFHKKQRERKGLRGLWGPGPSALLGFLLSFFDRKIFDFVKNKGRAQEKSGAAPEHFCAPFSTKTLLINTNKNQIHQKNNKEQNTQQKNNTTKMTKHNKNNRNNKTQQKTTKTTKNNKT